MLKQTLAYTALAASLLAVPAAAAPVGKDLVVALQPLQPHADQALRWAPALRPVAALARQGRHAQACRASEALRVDLMRKASRLFYAPARKNADLAGIEQFLDQWARGKSAVLEVPAETFAPAASWRALAVDSCVRAGLPDVALAFVAEAGGMQADAATTAALAVVLAQRSGAWSAGLPVLVGAAPMWRTLLLRALAAAPAQAAQLIGEARTLVTLPAEQALVDRVAAVLEKH